MTIESLISDEPPVYLLSQAKPGEVDKDGLPLHGLVVRKVISGRLYRPSGRQFEALRSLYVEATYQLIALDDTIENGWFVQGGGDPSRLFRVTGLFQTQYGKGQIPTYQTYALQQISGKGIQNPA